MLIKTIKILIALAIFGLLSLKVSAWCSVCNGCMSYGCHLQPGSWCIEDGNGYRCANYDGGQANCQFSALFINSDGNAVHSPRAGSNSCGNNCVHGPSSRSCNQQCSGGDTCTGGTQCTQINYVEYRCRNSSCSSETDCNCNQTTPTPPPTASPTPPPPSCANISLSISDPNCNNQINLTISGFNSSTYRYVSDTVAGNVNPGASVSVPGTTTVTRSLNDGSGPVTWTHRWQDCNSYGCSNTCSVTVSKNAQTFIAPACNGTNQMYLTVNPAPPIYADLPFSLRNQSSLPANQYRFLSDTYTGNIGGQSFNCTSPNPANSPTSTRDCTIPVSNTSTSYTWIHSWRTVNATCSNITRDCQANLDFQAKANPGYLITRFGDTYTRGKVEQLRFQVQDRFSTFTFGSQSDNYTKHLLKSLGDCNGNGYITCSGRNTLITPSYNDANYRSDWFSFYKDKLDQAEDSFTKATYGTDQNFDTLMSNNKNYYYIDGNLTVGGNRTCDGKRVFVVTGNLYITPRLNLSGDSACLFIVNGRTRIEPNGSGNGSIANYPYNSQIDLINAYIITNEYESRKDGEDVLVINGGLIIQSKTSLPVWGRNINTLGLNPDPTHPSEIIHYEGARYIKHFLSVLGDPNGLNIREYPYNTGN